MEWVLRSPQIHTTFGNLGFAHGDGYHVKETCNEALETILHNILTEDKYLRTYRRSISFGQNVNKDLIPLLLHAKEEKTIELLIKILVNLTIPIECLLVVEVISKTEFGRHTVFEINNLLTSAKAALTDCRATKVIIEFLKKNLDGQQNGLKEEQCTNICNGLLLLRNILHIPEEANNASPNASPHPVQNQILWNIFSQSVDKILIKLMVIPEATNWAVTMVQLIALLYKDQHVVTLHKLLNLWLEGSSSESSEDNESNTSPPDRGSDNSSPMLTSDPTSDSSDTGGSGKSNDEPNSVTNGWDASSMNTTSENGNQPFQPPQLSKKQQLKKTEKSDSNTSMDQSMKSDNEKGPSDNNNIQTQDTVLNTDKKAVISENSDCGYGTLIENQESISTSSNEDELPSKKPVHQKPHNPKQRINTKVRTAASTFQEKKRKKLVKRGKLNIINVQGLSHKTPTDDDISNILKEFTVDFLLKGYNHLVATLHTQILTNLHLEIDISHFFWLVTYFLKFAAQIELDLEHVCSVVSYEVISYLTAEGVNLCEQFELAIKLDGNDLTPCMRRLHLVVTAIREFVQAIDAYKKFTHICSDDQEALVNLQIKMCETEELRSLLVLHLRHYNPKYHSKQYLQDLIVTNHILLIFVDNVMKMPNYKGSSTMTEHIKQFATPEVMYQYGLLLEDYESNGEYVNDCVFTLMHHVGGELGCLISLFQPKILKTFTSIWKSEFEICDDWSDLIEYVINTFIKKPHTLQAPSNICIDNESFEEDKIFAKPFAVQQNSTLKIKSEDGEPENKKKQNTNSNGSGSSKDRWSEDELSSLSWNYMECSASPDVVGEIIKLFQEDGITKSRDSVICELYKQRLISENEFETVSKAESEKNAKDSQDAKETGNPGVDREITKLCEQLTQDGKFKFLSWVQQVLLDTCYAKICLQKRFADEFKTSHIKEVKLLTFELFRRKVTDVSVMSPTSYYSLNYHQAVPLVPWNCEQAEICKDLKFLQLLHKLGFHLPVDTGKVFVRVPHFWTAEYLYEIAGKVAHIDTSKLMFSVSDLILESSLVGPSPVNKCVLPPSPRVAENVLIPDQENFYQIHKQKQLAMMNYTPMPGSSFNSDSDESDKQNWLQLVQRSQECKHALNIKRSVIQENEDSGLVEMPSDKKAMSSPLLVAPAPHIPFDIPTVIPKEEEPFSEHLPEPDYNSVCETASVASNLTRMYVSDEDDKTEVLLIQPLDNQDDMLMQALDDQTDFLMGPLDSHDDLMEPLGLDDQDESLLQPTNHLDDSLMQLMSYQHKLAGSLYKQNDSVITAI